MPVTAHCFTNAVVSARLPRQRQEDEPLSDAPRTATHKRTDDLWR